MTFTKPTFLATAPPVKMQQHLPCWSRGRAFALSDTLDPTTDIRYVRDFDVTSRRINVGTGALTGVPSADVDGVNLNVGLRFKF